MSGTARGKEATYEERRRLNGTDKRTLQQAFTVAYFAVVHL